MQDIFQQTWLVPGTLAANHVIDFTMPCDAQIIHVSASNTSANAGTLDIGNDGDDDAYLDGVAFGVSNEPALYDRDDFVDSQFPHIAAGTDFKITITDHASHMANAAVVITFTPG